MTRRAIAVGLGLALLGAYVVRASRGSGPVLRVPIEKFDMSPDPKFHFTCPKDWTCPQLDNPDTWRPPGPVDPYDHDYMRPAEVRT